MLPGKLLPFLLLDHPANLTLFSWELDSFSISSFQRNSHSKYLMKASTNTSWLSFDSQILDYLLWWQDSKTDSWVLKSLLSLSSSESLAIKELASEVFLLLTADIDSKEQIESLNIPYPDLSSTDWHVYARWYVKTYERTTISVEKTQHSLFNHANRICETRSFIIHSSGRYCNWGSRSQRGFHFWIDLKPCAKSLKLLRLFTRWWRWKRSMSDSSLSSPLRSVIYV